VPASGVAGTFDKKATPGKSMLAEEKKTFVCFDHL
jgi:hypothetical protein